MATFEISILYTRGEDKKEKFKDKKGQGDTDTSLGRQENKEKGKEMGKEQKAKEKLQGDK